VLHCRLSVHMLQRATANVWNVISAARSLVMVCPAFPSLPVSAEGRRFKPRRAHCTSDPDSPPVQTASSLLQLIVAWISSPSSASSVTVQMQPCACEVQLHFQRLPEGPAAGAACERSKQGMKFPCAPLRHFPVAPLMPLLSAGPMTTGCGLVRDAELMARPRYRNEAVVWICMSP
jgi:hypothetical protein